MWVIVPVDPEAMPPYAALTGGLLMTWIVLRGIGTTILVPVIEELFFRDYLENKFQVEPTFGWSVVSVLGTTILFAALHDRWIEAFVAGVAFSLLRRYTGRITDAIAAHGTANGIVFLTALLLDRMEII